MEKEEQIRTIVDVLFVNTTSEQLPLEKCYELAEKIVEKLTHFNPVTELSGVSFSLNIPTWECGLD